MALAISRHEFIVTYEGPLHPSSAGVPSASSNRQSLCITLPQTGLDKISNTSYVTQDDLLSSISQKIGWPAYLLCIANQIANQQYINDDKLYPTHHTQQNNNNSLYQHEPLTINISSQYTSIRGGKGGFGTLLKGQSKQAGARTTLDFGACRDLSGRRLRHVNDEIKLRKWKELQAARDRAAKSGNNEEVDELSALKTPSGIRNWHLMVPSWSDAAAFSKKGKRKMERQYEREVRGRQSKEDKVKSAKEQKRLDEEWAVMEYVRRGEEEGKRVMGDSVKEGILAHMRKRKQESKEQQDEVKESVAATTTEEGAATTLATGENSLAAHLMTLSGDMSVFDAPESNNNKKQSSTDVTPKQSNNKLRIQSQSDFATAVVLLNADKLKDISSSNGQKNGVYVEYTIQTAGLAQIGWIRSPEGNTSSGGSGITFILNSDTGDGVGDDNASYGYDGSRGLKFHGGKEESISSETAWKAGDILGCYCKLTPDGMEIGYSVNGEDLGVAFTDSNTGDKFSYYPGVSLNLNETVDVNIGPDFAYEVKKGCIGACELVKTETDVDASGDDDTLQENSKKQLTAVDDNAPPKKRPRDESAAAKKKTTESTKQAIKQSEEKQTFDLNKCSSIDELKQMEPDRLKNILLSMGVKCGGTPDDRANRLFSLKGLRRDEYPKKVRGKNFIP